MKKSQRIFTSMHSAGLELTKLTYTRLEDNLIRHRGDSTYYTRVHDFFSSFALHPIYHPRIALALPPSGNSDMGSHPPPPSPLRYVPSLLSRKESSICSSLSSTRVELKVPTYAARRCQQLIMFIAFLKMKSKSHHGGNRSQGPTLAAFEGNRKTTAATGLYMQRWGCISFVWPFFVISVPLSCL